MTFLFARRKNSMQLRRNLTTLTSIAIMLAMGVVASTHRHDRESIDGLVEGHAGLCSHQHTAGHGDPSARESQSDSDPCQYDHHDCQVCKLLSSFDSTALVVIKFGFDTMVSEIPGSGAVSVSSGPVVRALARGPPA